MCFPADLEESCGQKSVLNTMNLLQRSPPVQGESSLPWMDPSGGELRDFMSGLGGNLVPFLRDMLSPAGRVAGPPALPRG